MVIREMSRGECLRLLASARVARLACSYENQPLVVPVYLTYHRPSSGEEWLYGFTTFGQKVAWMQANPQVCVEVDEVTACDQWVSVIAHGRYEELPETPPYDEERFRAWQILKTRPVWWQPASKAWEVRAHGNRAEPFIPVYYRIRIDRITGREATRDGEDAISHAVPSPSTVRWVWLYKTLRRVVTGYCSETETVNIND